MEKWKELYKKSFEIDDGSIVRNSFFGSFGGWTFKEELIEKLRMIEDDWDWRGGKKPSEEAIAGVKKVLDLFDEEQKKKLAVFPSCEGGVYVQYRDGDERVKVFVSEDGDIACKRCYFNYICSECDFNATQLVCDGSQRPDKKFVIFELVK